MVAEKAINGMSDAVVDVEPDPQPNLSGSNSSNSVGKFSRKLSNVSNAIQQRFNTVREEGNFTLGCSKVFHTRTRFLLMILVLFCLASIWSNILSFNFALICMKQGNGTHPSTEFTPQQYSYLTAAVAASALVSNFVIVSLVNQFGIRTVFAILGLISAIATVFMPFALQNTFYYTLGARMLQGVAFAANFPVIGAFTSKWTYYKQNGLFVSVLVANVQLSPAISMPISGSLCASSLGWPSVFYVHGLASLVLFTLFAIFYRNSPGKHPFVGAIELRKIAVGKSECSKEELKRIPYGPILKTASVWAVWIAALGNFVAVNMLFLYGPNYLHNVLNFPVRNTGFSASIPPLAQFLVKLLAGFTSDKIRFLSETNKLRLYNSIAFFGSAIAFALLTIMPLSYPLLCLAFLGIAAGILGFTTGGFFKAGPLVSKHYSHFVTGNVSLGITITMLIVPFIVGGLAPNETAAEWNNVFLTAAGVLVVCNLIFMVMCSAEPASWTTDEFSRSASRSRVHATESSTRISHMQPQMKMG
uniref:Major facilitator superfamily (MFS) profile domain-containing protein n=1 Tax=Panagrolaimus sp. JU765 TaxID=591449 RepID=A0AC34QK29_9BILA